MNIIISGSASGIGKAICEKFLDNKHNVIGFDTEEGTINHKNYAHHIHDIRTPLGNKYDMDTDILINCAGCFDENIAISVNLEGTITFTENFLNSKNLKSILFIASASARNGCEFPYYTASKAGIVGYMKNLAGGVAKRGITCNSISPGGVITSSNDHILKSEKLYKAVLDETLLGKRASVEEIADWAYFLTVMNRSMTGEDLLVDNGEMLKSNFIW